MGETLTVDGQAVKLDESEARFAAAMAAPRSDDPEHPAPPAREPVDPEAPYGRRLDGKPKVRPGGRPPKPREITAAPARPPGSAASAAAAPLDYSTGLAEFAEALWMVMAATPIPWDEIRVKVRAQAWVLRQNSEGVVSGVNIMAQHNATIRTGVEKLTTGSAGWVLPAVMALAPFGVQTAMIWRSPANGDMLDLAAETEAAWKDTFANMRAEFEAEMAAAAAAGLGDEQPGAGPVASGGAAA